ncbi:MAG: glucosamine-6-phosphate deaminase [Candidatus Riflebacteria bacterium]|nr:glucosamine-6-phosphate deaminase [Candidatus Riflebacteria bacterium]
MEVIIKSDKAEASKLGAKIIARLIRQNNKAVLGLATGSTPLQLYKQLVRMHQEEGLSFKDVTTFNLDEYVGLESDNPCSFYSEMHNNLFCHIDMAKGATHLPDGMAENIPDSCAAYEAAIAAAGGIDLQLLGIGHDGHLAFNEPGSSLASRTRLKTLSQKTIKANSRFFGSEDKVPRHVMTMGLSTIMAARQCILLAFGMDKAEAVRDMIEGPVSASCPGSILQFHERTIVLLDPEAASKLRRKQYYLDVYASKPAWQLWD